MSSDTLTQSPTAPEKPGPANAPQRRYGQWTAAVVVLLLWFTIGALYPQVFGVKAAR
ncbi:hypothetical protein [Streptomyces roseochromogenus]|uniref:Uncharacterized protein n=1 Tax=Streptomyces roseochromogenus subsp. oscitans DS 12.976 TaxID=1352936 RepID=V6JQH1_STRRC|nr:hypothetical protein [Streptomyces roseochromogenus]EST21973.1 hypothetical protein M878_35680 [Streptomyces roseochromogenus subsp. oscitans DS 12.976]